MSAENIVDSNAMIRETAAAQKKSHLKSPLLWLQLIVFLLGVGLLFFLVYKIGLQTLTETVRRIGWGIVVIIFLNGARHFLRAGALYLAIPPAHRRFRFRTAVAARLGGDAVSVVTFTGPFLGDAAKAALLRRNVPLAQGGAAVVVDNILYYISVLLMILAGVALMSFAFGRDDRAMKYVLLGITGFALLVFVVLASMVWFRFKPVGFLIRRLSKRNLAPDFIERKKAGIFELEANVYEFYENRRKTFFAVFGISLAAHALSVCEVYTALRLLDFPAGATVAFIIESLTKIVNFAFNFVPAGIGIYEGGNGVILSAIGYTTAAGVALALVRRGAIFFWTAVGIGILLWRAATHESGKIPERDD